MATKPVMLSAVDDLPQDPAPRRIGVMVPLPFPGPLDYALPEGMVLEPGDQVVVTISGRPWLGVVWNEGEGIVPAHKLKPVIERVDAPPLPDVLRRWIAWIADYTLTPPGLVLRLALRSPEGLGPPAPTILLRRGDVAGVKLSAQRKRVLDALEGDLALSAKALAELAGVSPAIIKGMTEAGQLAREVRLIEPSYPMPDLSLERAALSAEQAQAADALTARIGQGFSVTLLEGVTGSGKTEVYFEAVAKALADGRQVLILLPEIALTHQFLERFERRFGIAPAAWHSDVAQAEKRKLWRAIALGRAQVVVGARSALFLPFPDLGLIVIDEEHDGAYKQEDGVIYHARDMAVVRAQLGDAAVILASATPSLESQANVDRGRYHHVRLLARHGAAQMPSITAIDMRRERLGGQRFIAQRLAEALRATLERGEQSLLFLNRRGYAPLTLCRACGHRLQCPTCSSWLIEHRFEAKLVCHHCGFWRRLPQACPACASEHSWTACGPGVERVSEEVAQLLPKARIAILSADLPARDLRAAFDAFGDGRLDVVVGTQIVAKGHHFPKLTLVGVIDADLGMAGADPRAAERTFQLLSQVAGRAGREDHPGEVFIQTYDPHAHVMRALISGRGDHFYDVLKFEREAAAMPPYGRLVAVILSGPDFNEVNATGRSLAQVAPQGDGISVLGPAPASLAMLRGQHRMRLLLKAPRGIALTPLLRDWLDRAEIATKVRVTLDVDPQSFL